MYEGKIILAGARQRLLMPSEHCLTYFCKSIIADPIWSFQAVGVPVQGSLVSSPRPLRWSLLLLLEGGGDAEVLLSDIAGYKLKVEVMFESGLIDLSYTHTILKIYNSCVDAHAKSRR